MSMTNFFDDENDRDLQEIKDLETKAELKRQALAENFNKVKLSLGDFFLHILEDEKFSDLKEYTLANYENFCKQQKIVFDTKKSRDLKDKFIKSLKQTAPDNKPTASPDARETAQAVQGTNTPINF